MKGKVFPLFVILACAAAAFSYFRSEDVYSFWLRAYYIHYKKESPQRMTARAYELMREKDARAFLDHARKLALLYPDNSEAGFLEGIALLRSGDTEKGLARIAAASDTVTLSGPILDESVAALYKGGYYGEIVALMRGRKNGNADTHFSYGRALYETGRPGPAIGALNRARAQGRGGGELYYYLALCSDATGSPRDALSYMARAWNLEPGDERVARALVDMYLKAGMRDEAERLVRKIKR